jgi:glyceraldehyde-3-phosphate dehydrogenase/erythrose-4-phosphate dehydrogenase
VRTFEADVQYGEDWISVDGKKLKLLSTRDPAKAPWKELGVEIVIEGTGAFNDLAGPPSTSRLVLRRWSSPLLARTAQRMFAV